MTKPLKASCHCGAVQISIDDTPDFINDCDCSFCRKAGAIWGYFSTDDVIFSGDTIAYTRADRPAPVVEIHSCTKCASTTHWLITEAHQKSSGITGQMGVNMRLFNEADLVGVELRFPDGNNWKGEGDYGYRRDAVVIGADDN